MTGRGATTVVIGPLTRAGRASTELALSLGDDVVTVARHDDDAAVLAATGTTVVLAGRSAGQAVDLPGSGPVRVLVCALGPIHPGAARTDADAAAFARDLAVIEQLLSAAGDREVGVVLVSSIIALAPGTDRRYYGGWKCLVEQQLAQTVHRVAPHASYSVVYPGRLVDGDARVGLHTTYGRLASTIDDLAGGPSRARVSGLDARLWLLANGVKMLIRTVLPLGSPLAGRPIEQSVPASERYSTS